MSLINKYRPKTWSEVTGHKSEIVRLKSILKSKRNYNALTFIGPSGIGKTTLARVFASYLNCETGNFCGECEHCLLQKEKSSPDVLEMNAASSRNIDDVRNLIESLKYKPVIGRYKIIIIDEVHQLTPQAEQALLTSLEEPPKHVIFILCSMEPEKIKKAVLNRCNVFNLQPPSKDEIYSRLKYIAKKEKVSVPSKVLKVITYNSQGCVRYAVQLLDSAIQAIEEKPKLKKEKLEKYITESILKTGSSTEDKIAHDVLVGIFTGDYGKVHTSLLDVTDFIVLVNKLSYLTMYLIDRRLAGNHKMVWHTVANKELWNELKKDTPTITACYKVLSELNELKFRMGSFMVNNRLLFSDRLVMMAINNRSKNAQTK